MIALNESLARAERPRTTEEDQVDFQISPLSAGGIVIANMIGVGVFTTSGFALADLGSREAVLLAWVLGGGLAMAGALCYGAFARRLPESGGEYTFLSVTVHPLAGFLAGWVSLLGGFTAPIAAAGLGLQAYLASSFETTLRPEWIGTMAIGAAALVHGISLREGLRLQNVAVTGQVRNPATARAVAGHGARAIHVDLEHGPDGTARVCAHGGRRPFAALDRKRR
ncbi:MAG: amino acid permease [bacterium]|nr:amino acid permease [bacterium]